MYGQYVIYPAGLPFIFQANDFFQQHNTYPGEAHASQTYQRNVQ